MLWLQEEKIIADTTAYKLDCKPYSICVKWVSAKPAKVLQMGEAETYPNHQRECVHYGFIQKFICDLGERYNIREIAYDGWNATMKVQALKDEGFTMVPFGQSFRDMRSPTKEPMRILLERKLNHGGQVLRWNMYNGYVRMDPAGNLKIDIQKSTEKMDVVIALVMALDRAMKNQGGTSVYDATTAF